MGDFHKKTFNMPIEEAFVELKIELVDEKREGVRTLVKNNRD